MVSWRRLSSSVRLGHRQVWRGVKKDLHQDFLHADGAAFRVGRENDVIIPKAEIVPDRRIEMMAMPPSGSATGRKAIWRLLVAGFGLTNRASLGQKWPSCFLPSADYAGAGWNESGGEGICGFANRR